MPRQNSNQQGVSTISTNQQGVSTISTNQRGVSNIPTMMQQQAHEDSPPTELQSSHRPIVLGSIMRDTTIKLATNDFKLEGGFYGANISTATGGVGRNLATCLTQLDVSTTFVSAIGDDSDGNIILNESNLDPTFILKIPHASTSKDSLVLRPDGQLAFGVGDFSIFSKYDKEVMAAFKSVLNKSTPLVAIDGNYSTKIIEEAVQCCAELGVPIWFEPTDPQIADKPFLTEAWRQLSFISPNIEELLVIWDAFKKATGKEEAISSVRLSEDMDVDDIIKTCVPICRALVQHIPCVLLTLGRHGILLCHCHRGDDLSLSQLFSAFSAPTNTDSLQIIYSKESEEPHLSQQFLFLENHQSPLLHRQSNRFEQNHIIWQSNPSQTPLFSSIQKEPLQNKSFTATFFPELNRNSETPGLVSVSGAGDCIASGFVAGILKGHRVPQSVSEGMMAAWLSLHSSDTVPATITPTAITTSCEFTSIDVSRGVLA